MDQVAIFGASLSARETLRTALQRQEELLAALLRRFEQLTATSVPPRLRSEWHGPAERRYAQEADRLRRDLDRVAEQLRSALADTRRALDTMADGG